MVGAGRSVGQAAMGHAQQCSIRLMIDQVDLDQARPRRHLFAVVPPEAVGEAVDRNDLSELAAGDVLAGDVDEVKPTGMRFHRRFRAHPPQDLLGIGEESEHGRRRRSYLDLASAHKRFSHRKASLRQERGAIMKAHSFLRAYFGNYATVTALRRPRMLPARSCPSLSPGCSTIPATRTPPTISRP